MKRQLAMSFVVLFLFFSTGCTMLDGTPLEKVGNLLDKPISAITGAKEHPEKQLQQFIIDLQTQNYSAASEFVGNAAKSNYGQDKLPSAPVGSGDFILMRVEISKQDSSKAQVYYQCKGSTDQVADMVKEDGTWKVVNFGPYNDY